MTEVATFLFSAIRVSTPLVFAAIAAVITQQAGLLNMAVESTPDCKRGNSAYHNGRTADRPDRQNRNGTSGAADGRTQKKKTGFSFETDP